ncbi:hypothetical protein ONZ45_g14133 [Pleurotus djamor]|nr:hypothetical protein ONZ45_g14133 [Pleurotus djamor]
MAVLTTDFAAQQLIDRQIAQLQLTIRSLKQQRNMCSAFNQLPNDVLAMIFIAYKEEYSLTDISEHAQWVHILGALTIGFSDEYNDLECVQDFFAYASEHHLASLRSVKLDLHYHRIFQTVTINLETSLPWSQMSSLTYLELSEVLLPPDIPSLPSLSKLVISCRAADHGLSNDWITTFLRQTPNIEEIDLREIISSSDPFEDPDHTTIPFPLTRLRRIDVDAEGLDAIKLFDGLEIPTSTQVCGIYATCEKSDPIGAGVLSTLGSLISRLARTDQSKVVNELVFVADGDLYCIRLEAYEEGAERPFLELDLPVDRTSFTLDEVFDTCLSNISLTQVTDLTISNTFTEGRTSTKWLGMLSLFGNLRNLNFRACDALTPLSMLTRSENKLETVSLSFISPPSYYDVMAGDSDGSLANLEGFARRREAVGLLPTKIIINNCIITESQVDALRKYVTVEWDGVEDGDEDG